METLMKINSAVNSIVWGPLIIILIIGTGTYLSVMTKFFSITKLGYTLKNTLLKMFAKDDKGEGEVTAFQAVATALAATVGTGNIAGVATAIALGGPGAVFWMWLAAIMGMTTKFAEVVLAVNYREKTPDGRFVGGPMYFITNGLGKNWKWLAVLFALFGTFASFGIGCMVQSNSVALSAESTFGVPVMVTGIVLAILTGAVIIGGIKRIGAFTEKLVPFMAAIYIVGGLWLIIANASKLPLAFSLIFTNAFTGTAAVGGFSGTVMMQAIRYGVARGIFSNEAGLGSAPIAHAAATTDHPVRQGMWGVFEVFMDTIVICSITALSIMVTGVWESGESGAVLSAMAFNTGLPGVGKYIVSVGLILFAYSTILGWEYYGERCLEYLFGTKPIFAYRILWVVMVVVGAIGGLTFMWDLADTLNALMAFPNLVAVLMLSPVVFKLTKEFFAAEKSKAD
ncbi:MAG TPA: sodium:alanine symporter family protein [Sedimentibacter sp.]|nr:sodium:alanine symporter family protein [Sedimentibacter sp.]HRC80914.1 sodium:alanine symporter family protein [Sedimentibacter sp.]